MTKYERLQQLLKKTHSELLDVIVHSESLSARERESLRRIAEGILDASQNLAEPESRNSAIADVFRLLKQLLPFLGS